MSNSDFKALKITMTNSLLYDKNINNYMKIIGKSCFFVAQNIHVFFQQWSYIGFSQNLLLDLFENVNNLCFVYF